MQPGFCTRKNTSGARPCDRFPGVFRGAGYSAAACRCCKRFRIACHFCVPRRNAGHCEAVMREPVIQKKRSRLLVTVTDKSFDCRTCLRRRNESLRTERMRDSAHLRLGGNSGALQTGSFAIWTRTYNYCIGLPPITLTETSPALSSQ